MIILNNESADIIYLLLKIFSRIKAMMDGRKRNTAISAITMNAPR